MIGRMASGTGAEPLQRPASIADLFITFTLLALQGFGGVIAVVQRVLCEDKRWLSRTEFVEMLAVAQVLPGPNVCNVSLMVGDRFHGWRGAFAALAGMMTVPLLIVLLLTAVYARYADVPAVAGALRGMGAVAAGLIIGTGIKLAAVLRTSPLGVPVCLLLGASTFFAVGVMRWPLVWVLLVLGAVGIAFAWRRVTGPSSGDDANGRK